MNNPHPKGSPDWRAYERGLKWYVSQYEGCMAREDIAKVYDSVSHCTTRQIVDTFEDVMNGFLSIETLGKED